MVRLKPLLLPMLLVVLVSCNGDLDLNGGSGADKIYLEEVVPPCIPTVSEPDPCPTSLPLLTNTNSLSLSYISEVPTFTELLIVDNDDILAALHIVVRGTVQTGTTRCDRYSDVVPNYLDLPLSPRGFYFCIADIAVKEYIVGEGPPVLSVIMYRNNLWNYTDQEGNLTPNALPFLDEKEDDTVLKYEGKEMILFLSIPFSLAVEAWGTIGGIDRWFLQQTDEGVRAVAQNIGLARNDEMRSKLNLPLDEMVEDIKESSRERIRLTDGRVGIESGLPMLITDANELRDFYTTAGAVYEGEGATVLPPPVPGEGDPAPPTIPVNEGTVGSTAPIPGEESSISSSADDAGTTTTISEPTSTTTTFAADATVTTEVAVTTTAEVVITEAPAEDEAAITTSEETVIATTVPADESSVSDEATTTTLEAGNVLPADNDEPEENPSDSIAGETSVTTTIPPATNDEPAENTANPMSDEEVNVPTSRENNNNFPSSTMQSKQ